MTETDPIRRLMDQGVSIPHPQSVSIGPEVELERIAPGVIIYPGCRIAGAKTLIMSGCAIGREGPATIEDCQIAQGVELKGGYFKASLFLDKANMGAGAHVREACLLEEESGGAHTVGLKHTILMPFVTLGSLINLCDCLMSGGTSRSDHSEVGSSYIHFNYTPQQDKATPSLIGDVPRGVMLRERPIFLGGQGGLVGPSTIGFGSVIAAGVVFKGDLADNRLVRRRTFDHTEQEFVPGLYGEIKQRVAHNILYIANLMALRQWYMSVRSLYLDPALLRAASAILAAAVDERLARLEALAMKMPDAIERYKAAMRLESSETLIRQATEFHHAWQKVEDAMNSLREYSGDSVLKDKFVANLSKSKGAYIEAVKGLPEAVCLDGTQWLKGIVAEVTRTVLEDLPSFGPASDIV